MILTVGKRSATHGRVSDSATHGRVSDSATHGRMSDSATHGRVSDSATHSRVSDSEPTDECLNLPISYGVLEWLPGTDVILTDKVINDNITMGYYERYCVSGTSDHKL